MQGHSGIGSRLPVGRRVIAVLLFTMVAVVCLAPAGSLAVSLAKQDKTELEKSKLRAETTKLQDEGGSTAEVVRVVPVVTALVAVAGLVATLLKQITESARQQTLDREQRDHERLQRFDEQFNSAVEKLGSNVPSIRAAATAQLSTFLRPGQDGFEEEVFTLLLALLHFPNNDASDGMLVHLFQQAARRQIPRLHGAGSRMPLDLSHCYLARVDLSGMSLDDVDIGFAELHDARLNGCSMRRSHSYKAKLDGANLAGTDLSEARMVGASITHARLNEARLVSAKLKDVDASGAFFQRAAMQEIHLQGARLLGARFEGANLNNAYLQGATFDSAALDSIARGALHWRTANFDPSIEEELKRRSAEKP